MKNFSLSKLSWSLLILVFSSLLASDIEAQRGGSRSSGRSSGGSIGRSSGGSIGRSSGGSIGRSSGGSIGRSSGRSSIGRSSGGSSIGRSSIGSSSSLGRSSVGSSSSLGRGSSGSSRTIDSRGSGASRGSVTVIPSPGRTSSTDRGTSVVQRPSVDTTPRYDAGRSSIGSSTGRSSVGSSAGRSSGSEDRFVGSSVYEGRGAADSGGLIDVTPAARPRFRFPASYSEVLANRGRENAQAQERGAAATRLGRYGTNMSAQRTSGSSNARPSDVDQILSRYNRSSGDLARGASSARTPESALSRLRGGQGARRSDSSRGLSSANGTREYTRGPIGRRVAAAGGTRTPEATNGPGRRRAWEDNNPRNDVQGASTPSRVSSREQAGRRFQQVQGRIQEQGYLTGEEQAELGRAIASGPGGDFVGVDPRTAQARNSLGGGVVPGGTNGGTGGTGGVIPGGGANNNFFWGGGLGWSNYYGNPYGWYCSPFGFTFNAGIGFSYAFGPGSYWASPWGYTPYWCGFGAWYGWNWGFNNWYTNWYYPVAYYPTVVGASSTVIVYEDNDPDVIYVQDSSPDVIYIQGEPAGEAVAPAPEEPGVYMGDVPLLPAPAAADDSALPAGAETFLAQGDEAFRAGRYGEAVQLYARAIEEAPDVGVLYLVLSDALFATGDYHYAAYTIRRALRLDPSLVQGEVDKHEFYEDPAEFDRQLAVLEQYVLDHNTDGDARLVLATNYLFGGRPAMAVDQLEGPFSSALQADDAGALILDAARARQFGQSAAEADSMP